mgnify:CR=1 FL=1
MPLIADVSKEVARKFRCLVRHGDDKGVSLRATFIIDSLAAAENVKVEEQEVMQNSFAIIPHRSFYNYLRILWSFICTSYLFCIDCNQMNCSVIPT